MNGTPKRPAAPVHVSIGELRLVGYSKRDGERLGGAFQRELGRLLAHGGPPPAGFRQQKLALPHCASAGAERPAQTGRRLARAIVRSLRP